MWNEGGGRTYVGVLAGTTAEGRACPENRAPEARWTSSVTVTDHFTGMLALCAGLLDAYVADRDIIVALQDRLRDHMAGCSLDPLDRDVRYEPYALLASQRRESGAFADKFERALYGLFRDETYRQELRGHFEGKTASQEFEALMRIYANMPAGRAAPPVKAVPSPEIDEFKTNDLPLVSQDDGLRDKAPQTPEPDSVT